MKIKSYSFILASQYYKPHIGGIENSLFFLAKASLELGYKAKIFVSNKGIGKYEKLALFEEKDGIDIVRYRYPFLPNLLAIFTPIILMFNTYIGFRKLRMTNTHNEIVICRNHIVVLAALFAGYRKVVYVVPSMIKGLSDRKKESTTFFAKVIEFLLQKTVVSQHYFFQKLAIKKSHKIFVFSNNMRNQIEQQFGLWNSVVVNPGVDIKRFSFEKDKRVDLREKHKVNNKFVFLCLGRVEETKGYKDVLIAFSKLESSIKFNSKILIVGNGSEVKNLKQLVLGLDLINFVEFHGSTNKPEEYFAVADCFMMTSRYEAFGQTILESMASGLPIIAYRSDFVNIHTASSELIEDNINGFFCDFNLLNLIETMRKVFSLTSEEKEKMRNANINKVKNNYQWTNLLMNITKEVST